MRLLTLKDHRTYVDTYLDLLSMEEPVKKPVDQERYRQEIRQFVQERLYDSDLEIFLFQKDGAVVGFSEVSLEQKCLPDEDYPEVCLKIHRFFVIDREDAQIFFKLIKQWGRDKRASLIETSSDKATREKSDFFESQGLELIGSGIRNFYRGFI